MISSTTEARQREPNKTMMDVKESFEASGKGQVNLKEDNILHRCNKDPRHAAMLIVDSLSSATNQEKSLSVLLLLLVVLKSLNIAPFTLSNLNNKQ